MSSPDQLRSYAVDCARLARGASAPEDKARLLNMAQAWAYLAGRIERIGGFAKREAGPGEPAASRETPDRRGQDESSR